ncbi:MAG: Mur ligase domain-containing protein [Chloroflexota bacterium]|nr:Mur ligase domain-containing protein [Chloroflexota bacterium]
MGAGLAAARAPRAIREGERIHVVGAGGAGASAAALLAHRAGAAVSGCDAGGASPYSAALSAEGIALAWQHSSDHLSVGPGKTVAVVDRLAVTKALTSIEPDHPELLAARRLGVPLEAWQQVVADAAASAGQRLAAVAGTHGKSTSSGWLLHVLVRAGRDPSASVGALLPAALTGGAPGTARWGTGDTFVVEADEYAGNFDPYRPALSLLLNAEWDHPDVFADEAAVLDAFEAWLRAADGAAAARSASGKDSEGHVIVANVGDRGVLRLAERLQSRSSAGGLVRIALRDVAGSVPSGVSMAGRAARATAGRTSATTLDIEGMDGWPGPVPLRLDGRHNAANALCVAAAAWSLGVPAPAIADGLASFPGVGRRLELKGEPRGVTVLDDYGHHPTAIAATLGAVRERYPDRRVWAVYEPLTFHRTADLFDSFAAVLATADRAVIADIWPGRDPDTTITSAGALARAISAYGGPVATAPGSVETTAEHLAERVQEGDVVLVMGGGRSFVIAEHLVAILGEPSGTAR